ncbi:winged helix-turn-helix transcriptional regulator [Paracoccus stylophorae]|uniref:Winged helix-turn-helix transcriptional regulator n=1 Tax=Paracoccus stylophorae TaxID=659350 RepID=A0ABY7T127_9RHOB|nr:MarR family winged helix-turn-helix transcriptional regulator [Paracoccus stylophorae]WCR12276.1 winged helix-turn-helix transcriptional regulator [Paracoccus stylophorae]
MSNQPERPLVPFQTTIKVRDHCLCLHTQRAARRLARIFDDALRPVGLKSGQFSLLMSLNRPAPPSIGEVATVLGMDRTTLTANLKPLEKRGLVRVSADEEDRRTRRLSLTPAGEQLLKTAAPIWEATHARIAVHFEDGADKLRNDLATLARIEEAE